MQPCPLLDKDEPLALLHENFWGKNMADEEQQWLNAQQASPATGGEFGLRDQEEEAHRREDVDDPDDDIISGCYMLDIGIDGLFS